MGLGKIFTKKCAQSHVFSLWRLTWVFDGTWEKFHKKVCTVTRFFAVETILSFWMGLRKVSTKKCAQSYVSSLWRLTWVFDGTWKNFHKKCAQSHVSSLWRLSYVFEGTWKVSTKRCDQLHILFAVETILSFWMGLRKVSTKLCAQLHVFAVQTNLSFWWDLEKFSQKSVPSHTFFRCGD